jgi:hypothetical protein
VKRQARYETTVAKRTRTKRKTQKISFKLSSLRSKKKPKASGSPSLIGILKVLGVICILAAVLVGFVFLHKYVKRTVAVSARIGPVKLANPPAWITQPLREKIYSAATARGEDLKLDEDAARSIKNNLEREVAWLRNIKVQTTHKNFLVEADYRKPIALVKSGLHRFYVDEDLVVLDFLPMPNLLIVRVEGVPVVTMPPVGQAFERDDLAAGVDVLKLLCLMDKEVMPQRPLLREIEVIDVSNFAGRENPRAAHIVLYATDRTQIVWGAEVGMWRRHLEATDEEKLAMLYSFYNENGTLLAGVKYINLRDPQRSVPQPIDRY